MQKIRNEGMGPIGVRAMLTALLLLLTLGCQGADTQSQRTFETPEAAVEALFDAIERDDIDAVLGIFGREYQDAIVTPDWDAERDARQTIVEAAKPPDFALSLYFAYQRVSGVGFHSTAASGMKLGDRRSPENPSRVAQKRAAAFSSKSFRSPGPGPMSTAPSRIGTQVAPRSCSFRSST